MNRRELLERAAGAPLLAALAVQPVQRTTAARTVYPRRLAPGDTVALVGPASATFERMDLDIARESLEALGLKVVIGDHVRDRHGYLAGSDAARAADINRFFADPSIRAVLPIRGGWGSSRLLPYLDFAAIARNPKVVLGYSDITALLLAISARTGLVTFHGPNGMGRWDAWSAGFVRRVLFAGEAVRFENPRERGEFLAQTEHRTQTIVGGVARGRLLGGNLTVLTALLGSPYLPSWDGAILFLEDVGEDIYRVDRMLTSLKLAGVLGELRGLVFGTCEECEPGDGYGSLTLEEVLDDHVRPLNVPSWRGAMIGHRMPQFTLPVGAEVEIDATRATIRMLAPAVA
ncbi:MAG: LD-carboxypeptidase [Acidobacteria bacterium]|nr:LD-carboxypeptidase [Acidobacteriota bacterium]